MSATHGVPVEEEEDDDSGIDDEGPVRRTLPSIFNIIHHTSDIHQKKKKKKNLLLNYRNKKIRDVSLKILACSQPNTGTTTAYSLLAGPTPWQTAAPSSHAAWVQAANDESGCTAGRTGK
jgi:hypothetical protein